MTNNGKSEIAVSGTQCSNAGFLRFVKKQLAPGDKQEAAEGELRFSRFGNNKLC